MNLLDKVVRADGHRKSRFHDQQGHVIPTADFLRLPERVFQALRAKKGVFPDRPWWPVAAAEGVSKILRPDFQAVEFGSGMSTEWLSKRVKSLISVESKAEWHTRVIASIQKSDIDNAEVLLRSRAEYLDFAHTSPIDFVVIDGERRVDCIDWAMQYLKEGGFFYLDNSDRDVGHDTTGSRTKLLQLRDQGLIKVEFFRGIPPGLLAATEGALAQRL